MVKRFIRHIENTTYGALIAYLTVLFIFSHMIYFIIGVRFDDSPLREFWQYLDPELLRNKLLESCFYLHSQPPLFNLFLGIILKLFPGNEKFVFQIIYLAYGLTLYFFLFFLQTKLGISRITALFLSTLFMISPSFVLYENWLFYTFPLAMLLLLSAFFLYQFLDNGKWWAALCFFISLFLISGIRSVFHLSYYLFIVATLVVVYRRNRKIIILSALAPFLLLLSFYCKNFVLFDKFSTSSWMGMNIWSMTGVNMPLGERIRLVDEMKLSQVSTIERFSELSSYPSKYLNLKGYEDIPALRQVKKSTSYNNYNHLAYMAISEQYFKDALYILKHYPKTYLKGLSYSWRSYFKSSSDYSFLKINRSKLLFMNNLFDYLFYGKIPFQISKFSSIYLFLLLCLPLLVFYALGLAFKINSIGGALSFKQQILILYICFNIIYVAVIGNSLEAWENNRFRFITDPLYLALMGLFLQYSLKPRLSRIIWRKRDKSHKISRFHITSCQARRRVTSLKIPHQS